MKASENKFSGKQSTKFSECSQNAWKRSFFVASTLSLLSHNFIEPLVHSKHLVCMCFQALVFWHFCMCMCLCPKHGFQHKHFAWL